MILKNSLALVLVSLFVLASCKKESRNETPANPPVAVKPPLLLKDIETSSLPSPYYHLAYGSDSSLQSISFASGLLNYEAVYSNGRLAFLQNNTFGNRDRVIYSYNTGGSVKQLSFTDSLGVEFQVVLLTYQNGRLANLQKKTWENQSLILLKSIDLTYYADGNLESLVENRMAHPSNGQTASTFSDHYEQYDEQLNPESFSLLHTDFFEHLVFLPGIQLQKNNPGRVVRTGDGLNYIVNYQYTYHEKKLPLSKTGDVVISAGPQAGQHFQTTTTFTYY